MQAWPPRRSLTHRACADPEHPRRSRLNLTRDMAAPLKHLAFEVTGKVQKVYFRVHTAEEATRLRLVGYVANAKDGSVRGEAIGDQKAIDDFQHWLRHIGSPQSSITDAKLTVRDAPRDHGFTAFDVRRGPKV